MWQNTSNNALQPTCEAVNGASEARWFAAQALGVQPIRLHKASII